MAGTSLRHRAPGGERVELRADGRDVERGVHRAVQQQHAGLKFVVERTDEFSEIRRGIGILQFPEKFARNERDDAVGATRKGEEKFTALGAEPGELSEQGLADGRRRIVQQRCDRCFFRNRKRVCFHGFQRKVFAG